jgi:hypothetical protein
MSAGIGGKEDAMDIIIPQNSDNIHDMCFQQSSTVS